mmetsp:Transcript_5504/g.11508  ORF Transcript_5504/g.11508 Transcript_5504/m.11508 type:complete len:204 (-) Transcript_5504:322-933(-)
MAARGMASSRRRITISSWSSCTGSMSSAPASSSSITVKIRKKELVGTKLSLCFTGPPPRLRIFFTTLLTVGSCDGSLHTGPSTLATSPLLMQKRASSSESRNGLGAKVRCRENPTSCSASKSSNPSGMMSSYCQGCIHTSDKYASTAQSASLTSKPSIAPGLKVELCCNTVGQNAGTPPGSEAASTGCKSASVISFSTSANSA